MCLLKNKQGAYLPCLSNAIAILANHKKWLNVIAYDAFAGTVIKKNRPPWIPDTAPHDDSLGDWTANDSRRTVSWITQQYNCPIYTSVVEEAVQVVADRDIVHPVQSYLNDAKKEWDGKSRLETLLIRAAGAEDTDYVRAVTKNFFLSAVARIIQPGSKVDTMLILEGGQGAGKSTFFRILASDEWFLDTLFTPGTKDGYQVLRRKWIIEWSELDALNRAELSRVKAFVSSVKDTYRQSYGRAATDFLRQCVFVGTINPNEGYLNDQTGARRFWPVPVGKIDLALVREERDQLWGEAYARFKSNERWHLLDQKLLDAAAKEAAERRESDPWEDHFREFLHMNRGIYKKGGITIPDLLTNAVDMPKDRQDRSAQVKAGRALRAIGWGETQRGTDGIRRYFPDPGHLSLVNNTSNHPTKSRSTRGGTRSTNRSDSEGGSK